MHAALDLLQSGLQHGLVLDLTPSGHGTPPATALPYIAALLKPAVLACRRFTSASAACVFISFGAVMWDYAAVLFAIALVFTAVGQLATKWIMRRMHVSCLGATHVAKEGVYCWIATQQLDCQLQCQRVLGRAGLLLAGISCDNHAGRAVLCSAGSQQHNHFRHGGHHGGQRCGARNPGGWYCTIGASEHGPVLNRLPFSSGRR